MIINFEFETQYGKFGDALTFPDDQELPNGEEIENMKQQRLSNWLALFNESVQEIQEVVQDPTLDPIQDPIQDFGPT
jgi:hypothetical protein